MKQSLNENPLNYSIHKDEQNPTEPKKGVVTFLQAHRILHRILYHRNLLFFSADTKRAFSSILYGSILKIEKVNNLLVKLIKIKKFCNLIMI